MKPKTKLKIIDEYLPGAPQTFYVTDEWSDVLKDVRHTIEDIEEDSRVYNETDDIAIYPMESTAKEFNKLLEDYKSGKNRIKTIFDFTDYVYELFSYVYDIPNSRGKQEGYIPPRAIEMAERRYFVNCTCESEHHHRICLTKSQIESGEFEDYHTCGKS